MRDQRNGTLINVSGAIVSEGNRGAAIWTEIGCIADESFRVRLLTNPALILRYNQPNVAAMVDGQSISTQTQIIEKDDPTRAIIQMIRAASIQCDPIQLAFVRVTGPRTVDSNGDLISFVNETLITGTILTGIPEIDESRGVTEQSLTFNLQQTFDSPNPFNF